MTFKKFVRKELVSINENLGEHMRRTDALEKHVFSWKNRVLMYTSVTTAAVAALKAVLSLFH